MKEQIKFLRYYFIFFLLGSSFVGYGQSDPDLAHFFKVKGWINPALISGHYNHITVSALYRGQWTQIENRPVTNMLTIENYTKNGFGMGMYFTNDHLGFETINSISFNASKHLNVGANRISLGSGIGIINSNLKGSSLRFRTPDDPHAINFDTNDLMVEYHFGFAFNISALTLAASIKHNTLTSSTGFFKIKKHYYANAFYSWSLSHVIKLEPHILFKHDGITREFRFITYATVKDRYQGGISYRDDNTGGLFLGMRITNRLEISYGFDYAFQKILDSGQNSHEIFVSYSFFKKRMHTFKSIRNL